MSLQFKVVCACGWSAVSHTDKKAIGTDIKTPPNRTWLAKEHARYFGKWLADHFNGRNKEKSCPLFTKR